MTKRIQQTEQEKRNEEARTRINLKFLRYTPVVMAYLNDENEGRI